MPQEILRMVYFAYVHSVMSYGIIFGQTNGIVRKFLILKKGGIRIITNSTARYLCRELFKKLEILPLYSQYTSIFSQSIFVIKNKHLFSTNYQIHSVRTRLKTNLTSTYS